MSAALLVHVRLGSRVPLPWCFGPRWILTLEVDSDFKGGGGWFCQGWGPVHLLCEPALTGEFDGLSRDMAGGRVDWICSNRILLVENSIIDLSKPSMQPFQYTKLLERILVHLLVAADRNACSRLSIDEAD